MILTPTFYHESNRGNMASYIWFPESSDLANEKYSDVIFQVSYSAHTTMGCGKQDFISDIMHLLHLCEAHCLVAVVGPMCYHLVRHAGKMFY